MGQGNSRLLETKIWNISGSSIIQKEIVKELTIPDHRPQTTDNTYSEWRSVIDEPQLSILG